jgi:hypothetical protein
LSREHELIYRRATNDRTRAAEMGKAIRAIATAVVASVSMVSTVFAASDATPRSDSHYEIWCTTVEGSVYLAKRVDGSAIQLDKNPGGKDTATERFNENNPFGDHCVLSDLIMP